MEFASDPDAAAAALATSAVLAAHRGRVEEAEEAVERIGAVRSLLSTADVHLGRVIDGLYALAGTWAERLLAEARPGAQTLPNGGRRRETLRRFVPSIYDDGDRARDEAEQLASPYLRLLFTAAPLPFESAASSVEFLTGVRPDEADGTLTVHREGHWFRIEGGAPTSLMSRQPLRRIVRSIVGSHLEAGEPGRGVEELIEAGWPDAVVTKDSGSNRVYTAIRTLRDMGLEEYLVTGDQGYRFAASIAVRCTDEGIDAFRNR